MSGGVLANKATAMEMNNYFFDYLWRWFSGIFGEIDIESVGTQKANHYFFSWLKIFLVDVIGICSMVLRQVNILRILQEVIKLFISQIIIKITFFHVEDFCDHRHKKFLVYCYFWKDNLLGLFHRFIVVLHVEKCNHFLVIVLIRGEPKSELIRPFICVYAIVSCLRRYVPALN